MSQISFATSREENRTIDAIVKRAKQLNSKVDSISMHMDLTACHANGRPLKLAELLAADDFNFAHDVFGISRHLDRKTGQLTDCFLPRFAESDTAF